MKTFKNSPVILVNCAKNLVFTWIALILLSTSAYSQILDDLLEPNVSVKILHPPRLGFKTDKVVFNNATGECSDRIIKSLMSDFVNSGLEVLDREHLFTILNEHKLTFSGYIDPNSALEIGKIIGPSVLINIDVLRCNTEVNNSLYKDRKVVDKEKDTTYFIRTYIARVTSYLKVSVQTTDLSTCKIYTAQIFDYNPVEEYSSEKGVPVAPDPVKLEEIALNRFIGDVHVLYLPWTEVKELVFYNDKEGGLKKAYKALKSGNHDLAYKLSVENLEACKKSNEIKDKTLAHAYYNLGMMYFVMNDYDNALLNLMEARKIKPGSVVERSISACNKAVELQSEMQLIEDNAALQTQQLASEKEEAEQMRMKNTLTNEDIITMTQKKFSTNLILQKIKTSDCNFNTTTTDLEKLTKAGVAEEVIMLMMEKQ